MEALDVISKRYFTEYVNEVGHRIPSLIEQFGFKNNDTSITYQVQSSAVYSSNIEGNTIDLNSFMNSKLSKEKFKKVKELNEIEDLILAYNFAQKELLTEINLCKVHKILTKSLLISSLRGKYRNDKVGVFGQSGLVYLAVEAENIKNEIGDFFVKINDLLNLQLNETEVFYHASLIHLKFVHIHPFRDGNGRVARILEKWFIVSKLGNKFWELPSEKYYKEHQPEYYKNLNLGVNYYELNYDLCLPFLTMLAFSLEHKGNA